MANSDQSNLIKKILERFSLQSYFESFIENGYDDLQFLKKQMSDSEVDTLLKDIGMTKNGHIMRLKNALNALKSEDSASASVVKANSAEDISSQPALQPPSKSASVKPSCEYNTSNRSNY